VGSVICTYVKTQLIIWVVVFWMIKYDTITSYSTVWQKTHLPIYMCRMGVKCNEKFPYRHNWVFRIWEDFACVGPSTYKWKMDSYKFCNDMGIILYSSLLFSYHFCNKFNHKIFQQVYTFCVWILIIPKSKHHTSQFFGEKSFTSWKSCSKGCLCLFLFKLLSEMSVWICINNTYAQKYTHHYKLLLLF
jgi:hypothetical protein